VAFVFQKKIFQTQKAPPPQNKFNPASLKKPPQGDESSKEKLARSLCLPRSRLGLRPRSPSTFHPLLSTPLLKKPPIGMKVVSRKRLC
jgi:hypothetical protein